MGATDTLQRDVCIVCQTVSVYTLHSGLSRGAMWYLDHDICALVPSQSALTNVSPGGLQQNPHCINSIA